MSQAGLLGIAVLGRVAIANQHRIGDRLQSQHFAHLSVRAGGEEGETDLVLLPVDRPEIAGLHLAAPRAARFDRRLVHRGDAAQTDRGELRRIDRLQQSDRALCELRQPWPADRDP